MGSIFPECDQTFTKSTKFTAMIATAVSTVERLRAAFLLR